jgi:hypothetical protein
MRFRKMESKISEEMARRYLWAGVIGVILGLLAAAGYSVWWIMAIKNIGQ